MRRIWVLKYYYVYWLRDSLPVTCLVALYTPAFVAAVAHVGGHAAVRDKQCVLCCPTVTTIKALGDAEEYHAGVN